MALPARKAFECVSLIDAAQPLPVLKSTPQAQDTFRAWGAGFYIGAVLYL